MRKLQPPELSNLSTIITASLAAPFERGQRLTRFFAARRLFGDA